jgi:hypothetical protein
VHDGIGAARNSLLEVSWGGVGNADVSWFWDEPYAPDWSLAARVHLVQLPGLLQLLHGPKRPFAVFARQGVSRVAWRRSATSARRRRVALRWPIRRSDATACVSAAARDDLQRALGSGSDRLEVVHNRITFKPGNGRGVRSALGVEAEMSEVISAGRKACSCPPGTPLPCTRARSRLSVSG